MDHGEKQAGSFLIWQKATQEAKEQIQNVLIRQMRQRRYAYYILCAPNSGKSGRHPHRAHVSQKHAQPCAET